jgi:hypothetical protein
MDDLEDEIDQEQLEEYKEMVDDLGAFPVSWSLQSFVVVFSCTVQPWFSFFE